MQPDRLFVWNELQRNEATSLHDFPVDRSIATGAPRFDDFFALRPTTSRQTFLAPLGLDPNRPCLMYLGSSSSWSRIPTPRSSAPGSARSVVLPDARS